MGSPLRGGSTFPLRSRSPTRHSRGRHAVDQAGGRRAGGVGAGGAARGAADRPVVTVKAGPTGWAQVNGWRGNTAVEARIEYDLYYIKQWSLRLDLQIMWLVQDAVETQISLCSGR